MTRQDIPDADAWTPCSPGTLVQLNRRIRAEQKRTTVVRIAAPVVLFVCVGLGVWLMSGRTMHDDFHFGGVTCTEVQSGLQQYAMGQLSPEDRIAFDAHLAQCPRCQERMRAMQNAEAMPARLDVETRQERNSAERSEPHRQLLATLLD